MFEVKMPQWGMSMTEGQIVQWHKQVGDAVEIGEPLVEIETAKSVQDLESPVSGTVMKHVAAVDDIVPVQGVIAIIE